MLSTKLLQRDSRFIELRPEYAIIFHFMAILQMWKDLFQAKHLGKNHKSAGMQILCDAAVKA